MLLALLFSTGAQLGSRIPAAEDWRKVESADEERRIEQAFGKCVVKKRARAAQDFVLRPDVNARESKADARLQAQVADGNCLLSASKNDGDVRLKLPGDTMRYSLASALFTLQLASRPPLASPETIAPLAHPVLDESALLKTAKVEAERARRPIDVELARKKEIARVFWSKLGECVVREAPAETYSLLRTEVVSASENAAIQRVMPALGACIPAGAQMELSKSLIRGTIAYNYYRLAMAPRLADQPASPAQ